MAPPPFTLRPAIPSDAAAMVAYAQALYAEGNPFLPCAPGEFRYTVDEERALVEKASTSGNSVYLLAFAGKDLVGLANCTGGTRLANRHNAILGISVHKDHRKQGIGTAMLTWLLDWARRTHVIRRVELFVLADNEHAIHIYGKFGFKHEGTRRRALLRDGHYVDDHIMALQLVP